MNPNLWNIKEILNIPNGGSKSSGRSGPTDDYSSLTDSQFMLSSQLWPDQMIPSQEMNLQSEIPLRNSQEVNELDVPTNYHARPRQFGGDSKGESKMPNFTCRKTNGFLEMFEEEKKRAEKRAEREMLVGELSQLKGCMEHIKNSLRDMDGHAGPTARVVEAFDGFTKTLQGAVGSIKEVFTAQLEAVLDKLTQHAEVVSGVATLATCLRSIQGELESFRTENARQQCMMGEILSSLQALASARLRTASVTDGCVQTSPRLGEGLQPVTMETQNFQGRQVRSGPPEGGGGVLGAGRGGGVLGAGRGGGVLGPAPAGEPGAHSEGRAERAPRQGPYRTRSDTPRPPPPRIWRGAAADTRRDAPRRDAPRREAPRRDAPRGNRARLPRARRGKAPPPLRGRGYGDRGGAVTPAPTSRLSPANHTPENPAVLYDRWCQDSRGAQRVSGRETSAASWVIPLPEAQPGGTGTGSWQPFDVCDDSD